MINVRDLQEADAGTPLEVFGPVLFNTFKHHAGALRARIDRLAGPESLQEFAGRLAVLGAKLMDLYTGELWPRDISLRIVDNLRQQGALEPEAFRAWLSAREAYAVVEFAEDSSRWVIRWGEAKRFIHLHPGRWSPGTLRVRANVLKTACAAVAYARVFGGDPGDRDLLNIVRREYLSLPPLGHGPEGDAGLAAVLAVLRPHP